MSSSNHNDFTQQVMGRRTLFSLTGLGALGLGISGCSSSEEETNAESEYDAYSVDSSSRTAAPEREYRDLSQALENLKNDSGAADLSISVYDYETSNSYVYEPDYRGYEASVSKIPISLSVMRNAFDQGITIDENTAELVRLSIGFSDNDATMSLFGSLGETTEEQDAQINETYQKLGITNTQSVGGWGGNETNTPDQVIIARAVYEGVDWIASTDMDILREALQATDAESQGWGVGVLANLEGAGAQQTEVGTAENVMCKNGWITDDAGLWYVNTTGVCQFNGSTYAIAAMVQGLTVLEDGQAVVSQAVEKAVEYLNA